MSVARFDIPEIVRSLERTQRAYEAIEQSLDACRGAMPRESVANMVEGYRYIDQLLGQGTDLFAMGNSSLLLELNALVLCGSDNEKRELFKLHLQQTRKKFYDDEQGGIGSLMEWLAFHASDSFFRRIAGLYIQVTSQPQLFIEGNHRSAILMVSYMLGREGYPPFVLTSDNAKGLLDRSRAIGELKKHGFSSLIRIPLLCNQLAAILKGGLEQRHSLATVSSHEATAIKPLRHDR